METNFEYPSKILKSDAIDTWTLREQEEIKDLTQGPHIFLYDIYTGIISHCQTNKPTNQEPLYESEHIIILDSDSTIGCQEYEYPPGLTLVLGLFMFLLYTYFQNHYLWPYIR